MAHLLHVDSSPRSGDGPHPSRSRILAREFVEAWKQTHLNGRVTYRDIGRNPVPPIDENWIAAAYLPPERRSPTLQSAIRLSDQLVDEFLAADLYVLGVPMYNFGIPSVLKAYIDQIVRIGRTFEFTPENSANPYQPLVLSKAMVILAARGGAGFGMGGPNAALNYQTPYLQTIFGFLGITDITVIDVEGDELGAGKQEEAIALARAQIAQWVHR